MVTCVSLYTDGDIYGSEGQYIRYEEGAWDSPEAYEEVSSGHPYANPRGRSGSARPSRSYGVDRASDDDMDEGDAYVTPETTAPLQAAGQVSTTPVTLKLLIVLVPLPLPLPSPLPLALSSPTLTFTLPLRVPLPLSYHYLYLYPYL